MNAAARGRALAAGQIDQAQFTATACRGLAPSPRTGSGGTGADRDARRFRRHGDRQQSVATTAARILQCGRCLSGLRTLLHVGHQRPQGADHVVGQS